MRYYDTHITVKLTISLIECHVLAKNGCWISQLYAIDKCPISKYFIFCEFINMIIWSPNLQILKLHSLQLIFIVLTHIFKKERITAIGKL